MDDRRLSGTRRSTSKSASATASKRTAASRLAKRSLTLHGHATSVALEAAFWSALDAWADEEGLTAAALISRIDLERHHGSLASAIRVAVLTYAQARAARDGDGS